MPQLLRIKFENIGHKDARLDPLLLDFRGPDIEPADTVLWLRNGGGKSSILNLFFSVICPGRREFLGSEAEGRVRRIEDYISGEDTAHICIEWRLEQQKEAALLTGATLEWRGHQYSSDPSRLKRFFYTVMVTPDSPITLDRLPIRHEKEGMHYKLLLSAFRDELKQIRDTYPQGNIFMTDNLTEWRDHLMSYGLDPELIRYQIRMNRREGAADEMFRFRSAQEFVDFIIGLALDPCASDKISENLLQYRESLLRRPKLEVEKEFLQGLEEPLGELVNLNEDRILQQGEIGSIKGQIYEFIIGIDEKRRKHEEQISSLMAENKGLIKDREELEKELTHILDKATLLQCYVTGLSYRESESLLHQVREEQLDTQKKRDYLIGAEKLYTLENLEKTVEVRKEELSRQMKNTMPVRDKLEEVGTKLFLVLEQRSARLDEKKEELRKKIQGTREHIQKTLDIKIRLRQRYGELKSEQKSIDERMKGAREEKENFIQRGILDKEQDIDEAIAQHRETLDTLVASLELLKKRRAEIVKEQDRISSLLRDRDREIATLSASLSEICKNIAEAKSWGEEIEKNGFLKAFLEVEDVDLSALNEDILEALEKRSQALRDEAVRQQVDRSENLRALEALESTGLLPPSRDVEEILKTLEHEDIPAQSGWSYLSQKYEPDEWRKCIRSHPDCVTGVVIQKEYYTQAKKLLDHDQINLEGPVRIGAPEIFESGGKLEGSVIGPSSRSLFDPTSALEEKKKRGSKLEDIDKEVHKVEEERKALDRLMAELKTFFAHTPSSWFSRQENLKNDLERKLQNLRTEVKEIEEKKQAVEVESEKIDEEEMEGRNNERSLLEGIHDLEHYKHRYELLEERWMESLQTLQMEQVELEEEQNEVEEKLREFSHEEEDVSLEISELEHEITLVNEEKKRIEFKTDDESLDVQENDIALLRESYKILMEQYAGYSGRETLEAELRILKQKLKEEDKVFQRYLKSKGVNRSDIAEILKNIKNPETISEQIAEVEDNLTKLTLRVGNLENQTRQRSDENQKQMRLFQDRQSKRMAPITLPPEMVPTTSTEAAQKAKEAFDKIAELQEGKEKISDQLKDMEKRLEEIKRSVENLKSHKKRLEEWSVHYKTLLELSEIRKEVVIIPDKLEELEANLDGLGKRLREAGTNYESFKRRLNSTTETLRQWSRRENFEILTGRIKERFLTDSGENLLLCAKEYYKEIEVRQQVLADTLEEIGRHRNLLIDEARDATVEAFRLLKRTAEASRISNEIPEWEGLTFLKINFTKAEHLEEERKRLGSLLDRLVQEGDIPKGIDLIKQTLRVLVGNEFEVSLLKPDSVLRRHHEPITEMAAFSRGQQLTAAILIYCTLARLRSKSRGLPNAGASVLILDNPIGTCSNIQLLDLQVRIAKAMGIQLVYTTGVNDLDALATLPNIVRLRNQHISKRGLRHVTLSEYSEGISAVRIARRDNADGAVNTQTTVEQDEIKEPATEQTIPDEIIEQPMEQVPEPASIQNEELNTPEQSREG